jgi:hypothetical protein
MTKPLAVSYMLGLPNTIAPCLVAENFGRVVLFTVFVYYILTTYAGGFFTSTGSGLTSVVLVFTTATSITLSIQ